MPEPYSIDYESRVDGKVYQRCDIYDADENPIAHCYDEHKAREIVIALRMRAELVELLHKCMPYLAGNPGLYGTVEAAIAKAEGEKGETHARRPDLPRPTPG